ncbi:MAG TPA: sialidase family protein [Chloroflexia bacterium]|nr:sialidase family protein [Chloroflexia bacterium]
MPKFKPVVVMAMVAILGVIAVVGAFAVNGSRSTVATNISELTVPGANMPFAANFKASPATGAEAVASVPYANIRVNQDQTQEAQNEPFVAVNPSNSRHIVVGANNWAAGNGRFEVTAYVSFDGGATWAESHPYIDRNAGRIDAADPTVAFGSGNTVYFGFVALTPAPGAVAVSTSHDGGLTWSSQSWATSFAGAADKPAIAATSTGKLYVFYQSQALFSTVSSNGGQSWSASSLIEDGGRNAAPVSDSAGNVYVFYNTASAIRMARVGQTQRMQLSTVANTVGLRQRPVQYRANIYPTAGIASNGTLYVAWPDGVSSQTGNDIFISHLTANSDQGWTAPVRVNSDSGNADQLMPALSVGSDNKVTVAWLDTRNDASRVNYDVYMARSANGTTFGANTRVTAVSSNPNNDPRTQGQLIGDYFALASGTNSVYVLWTDTRNNNEDIYLAPVSTTNN